MEISDSGKAMKYYKLYFLRFTINEQIISSLVPFFTNNKKKENQ
ncbi:hypothetical protein [Niallia sp. FSL R7-0271]